jgi:hypothetical protein
MRFYKELFSKMLGEEQFRLEGRLFCYEDTAESFARSNDLTLVEAKGVFTQTRSLALDRQDMALKRLARSRISINRRQRPEVGRGWASNDSVFVNRRASG